MNKQTLPPEQLAEIEATLRDIRTVLHQPSSRERVVTEIRQLAETVTEQLLRKWESDVARKLNLGEPVVEAEITSFRSVVAKGFEEVLCERA